MWHKREDVDILNFPVFITSLPFVLEILLLSACDVKNIFV